MELTKAESEKNKAAIEAWRKERKLERKLAEGFVPAPKQKPVPDKKTRALGILSTAIGTALRKGITPFEVLRELNTQCERSSGPSPRVLAAMKAYRESK